MVSRKLHEIMASFPSTLSIATLNSDSLFCAPLETLFTRPVESHGSVSEESLSHCGIYCIGYREFSEIEHVDFPNAYLSCSV